MTLALPDPQVFDMPGIQRNFEALRSEVGTVAIGYLPPQASDGDEIFYVANATTGVVWHLKYRAANPTASKWACVGGPPLYVQALADFTTTSETYVQDGVTTQITVPLAGDYITEFGFDGTLIGSTGPGGSAKAIIFAAGVQVGQYASAATGSNLGADGAYFQSASNSQTLPIAAGTTVELRYRRNAVGAATGTAHLENRWLRVLPVRVG